MATNITGHCGYELPLWLHAMVTAGVGLTPLAATSKTHYIHHLDPRFNKVRAALQCGSQTCSVGRTMGYQKALNANWTRLLAQKACTAAPRCFPLWPSAQC